MTEQLTIDEALDNLRGVLRLIAGDPMKKPTVRAVAETIARTHQVGDTISANSIRPHLPAWVNTAAIGPAFGHLIKAGALQPLALIPSTDRGTHGKRIGVYEVTRDALEAVA